MRKTFAFIFAVLPSSNSIYGSQPKSSRWKILSTILSWLNSYSSGSDWLPEDFLDKQKCCQHSNIECRGVKGGLRTPRQPSQFKYCRGRLGILDFAIDKNHTWLFKTSDTYIHSCTQAVSKYTRIRKTCIGRIKLVLKLAHRHAKLVKLIHFYKEK